MLLLSFGIFVILSLTFIFFTRFLFSIPLPLANSIMGHLDIDTFVTLETNQT